MIQMEGVSKDYQVGGAAVHALSEVGLAIGAGESVALLGPSGSGKSTLMHLIGCLDTPSRGRYRFEGREVGRLDVNALAALRCATFGFVFQRFHLMPRATAWENVAMPMRFAGVAPAERLRRAAALLERVGLADRAEHRPSELSGGQQQRVAIARALANQPRVILADEPTGNLDSVSGAEVVALLGELHGEGRTIVTVTHDEAIAARAQRVIRLLDGRVVADDSG
ncbi:MAG: ABC transporter ATP-binding protein [Planctomycetes bacterium]|nr:ABC transporter ATP-binding protein [Planctomycetota bacterium]